MLPVAYENFVHFQGDQVCIQESNSLLAGAISIKTTYADQFNEDIFSSRDNRI